MMLGLIIVGYILSLAYTISINSDVHVAKIDKCSNINGAGCKGARMVFLCI